MSESMSEPKSGKDFYYTIQQRGTAEFKDRGSRFLAYAYPIQNIAEFKACLDEIKKEHPRATHHCFAYRLGLAGDQFRVSDAGEPSGTAGRPILGQIDSRQLTNLLIVVVRYFGGTLLGVPGLINAYRSAAAMVLQVTPLLQKAVEIPYRLQFDYTVMNHVMMVVKQFGCTVVSQESQLFCQLMLGIPQNRLTEVIYRLEDIRGLTLEREP